MKKYCTEDMELRRANIVEANSMALDSEMPSETYEDMNIIYVPFVRETAERKCANFCFEKKTENEGQQQRILKRCFFHY